MSEYSPSCFVSPVPPVTHPQMKQDLHREARGGGNMVLSVNLLETFRKLS